MSQISRGATLGCISQQQAIKAPDKHLHKVQQAPVQGHSSTITSWFSSGREKKIYELLKNPSDLKMSFP